MSEFYAGLPPGCDRDGDFLMAISMPRCLVKGHVVGCTPPEQLQVDRAIEGGLDAGAALSEATPIIYLL